VQTVFGANKNPAEQAKHKLEALEFAIAAEDKLAVRPADAAQLAQFVLAVPHVPNWASA